jgi:hypothetical protein
MRSETRRWDTEVECIRLEFAESMGWCIAPAYKYNLIVNEKFRIILVT